MSWLERALELFNVERGSPAALPSLRHLGLSEYGAPRFLETRGMMTVHPHPSALSKSNVKKRAEPPDHGPDLLDQASVHAECVPSESRGSVLHSRQASAAVRSSVDE